MTKFICQELLYEFATGNLDLDRQKALDVHLSGCRESQRELEKLKAGFQFTSRLSKVTVSADLRAALLGFEPAWKRKLRQWTVWWSNYGWKSLPYVVLVAVLGLGAAVLKPWTALNQKEVVIVEAPKAKVDVVPPPDDVQVQPKGVTPLVQNAEDAAEPPVRAFLLRAEMKVNDLSARAGEVRDKIYALNGKVAGQEDLGAISSENGSAYFHFSLPESNQTEFETFLKTFGPVQFKQEPHPRVMPEGEIHLILTLKDGGTNDSREKAETP